MTVAGLITSLQLKRTKKGDLWAIATVEDLDGAIECLFFPSAYMTYSTMLAQDTVCAVKGRVSARDDSISIFAQELTIPDIKEGPRGPVVLTLPLGPGDPGRRREPQARAGRAPRRHRGAGEAHPARPVGAHVARRLAPRQRDVRALRRPQGPPRPGLPRPDERPPTAGDLRRARMAALLGLGWPRSAHALGTPRLGARGRARALGALQAQDYQSGAWSLGVRSGLTAARSRRPCSRARSCAPGRCAARSTGCRPRTRGGCAGCSRPPQHDASPTRYAQLGLTEADVDLAGPLFEEHLGEPMSRPEVAALLVEHGIDPTDSATTTSSGTTA